MLPSEKHQQLLKAAKAAAAAKAQQEAQAEHVAEVRSADVLVQFPHCLSDLVADSGTVRAAAATRGRQAEPAHRHHTSMPAGGCAEAAARTGGWETAAGAIWPAAAAGSRSPIPTAAAN
jgi:hypothetical protein